MPLYKEAAEAAQVTGESEPAVLDRNTLVKRGFEQPQWYLEKRSFNIRIRAETVKQFLGARRFESMLDIGCGDGSISVPLLAAHNRLTLLDMSTTMLGIAKARIPAELSSRVEIVNDRFMQAKLKTGGYDLIICLGVLAYIDDPQSFAEKLLSLLKPGGSLVLECTDSSHPVNYLVQLIGRTRSLFRTSKFLLVHHSSSNIAEIFTRLGFKLCAVFRYTLPPSGIRTLLRQEFLYKTVRTLHGTSAHNRLAWLGDECIFYFRDTGREETPESIPSPPTALKH